MKAVRQIHRAIEKVLDVVTIVLMAGIACLIMLQVILRSLGCGVQWTEEAARYSYVAIVFLGGVLCIGQDSHISITLLTDALPEKVCRWLKAVIHLAMGVFMGFCVKGLAVMITSATGVVATSMPWFKMSYLYVAALLGCVLMAVVCVLRAVELVFAKKEEE